MNVRIASLPLALVLASCSTALSAAPTAAPSAVEGSWIADDLHEHEAGAVTVSAEWSTAGNALNISLDTHSVDVDAFDLQQLARVRLDGGPWFAPTEGKLPTGGQHHRSATRR